MASPFSVDITPDWQGLLGCIRRRGTPERVFHIELFLDPEVEAAIWDQYNLGDGIDGHDPFYDLRRKVALQRFLGYDYVYVSCEDEVPMPLMQTTVQDSAALERTGGRTFMDEQRGPITNWQAFESYPWPDPEVASMAAFEWYEENLPQDMCVIAFGGFSHLFEYLSWLMGYETLCYSLYDRRDLVAAISERLIDISRRVLDRILGFERVKLIWGSDDMGFRTATLISPQDLREFILPGHKLLAEMSHAAGRPYLLHSCGNLARIMDDLIDDVGIDALHSFEDTITTVTEAKKAFGDRIALLGGVDVDFLCRADEMQVRQRVRQTLDVCMPGGGYCLGSGNSIANYVPLGNYLAMLDEGRRYAA